MHYMDGSTWLETWQAGSPAEGCGTQLLHMMVVQTLIHYANQLTVNGVGAHIGLAKFIIQEKMELLLMINLLYHVYFFLVQVQK